MRMLLALVLLAGCGSSKSEPPPAPQSGFHADMIVKIEAYAERICACTTHACGKQVNDELEAFTRKAEPPAGAPAATDPQRIKFNDVMNRYTQCLTKAMRLPE